jgi:hypothetical protein
LYRHELDASAFFEAAITLVIDDAGAAGRVLSVWLSALH